MATRRTILAACPIFALLLVVPVQPLLADAPILTLSFRDNGELRTLAQDLAALDAMPQTSFRTTTPWQETAMEFSGVSLKDYLAAAGATGETIRFTALNDYQVQGLIADLVEADALLATRRDGRTMSIGEKGPIFVVFPYDSRPELRQQTYYSRSVWQLDRIEVLS